MPFDPELDVELWKEEVVFEDRNTKVTVAVMQYNEGVKKLQIGRANLRNEDWSFAKLGRLMKDEAVAIAPLVQKAIEHMD